MEAATATRTDTALDTVPGTDPVPVSALNDAGLIAALDDAFAERRRADARLSRLAGEISERSRISLGADGLARRHGNSNAVGMVASIGRVSSAEASRLCRVGVATAPRFTIAGEKLPSVFAALASALDTGVVTVDAASYIVASIDAARPRATPENLIAAETHLVAFASEAAADEVRKLAAHWRDALDVDGIEPREAELVAARSVKRIILPNGMKRFVIDLDPLSAAYLDTAIDAELAATLRAVRFIDRGDDVGGTAPNVSDGSVADTRTVPQIAADAIVDIARHALTCENSVPALASATVVVRMTLDSLLTGLGEAGIDGSEQPISAATARRLAADADIIPIVLGSESDILDMGRGQRLFSRAQRTALAERDGGCVEPNCNRPPIYTEAHHVRWWKRDSGRTDLNNGVLLCSRAHHLIHNSGWNIRVEHNVPWLIPPADIDPHQKPRRGGRPPAPRLDASEPP